MMKLIEVDNDQSRSETPNTAAIRPRRTWLNPRLTPGTSRPDTSTSTGTSSSSGRHRAVILTPINITNTTHHHHQASSQAKENLGDTGVATHKATPRLV
jgi:hypothetical protein